MTLVLVRKLLRDVRGTLVAIALLLGAFQALWAKITHRILGELSPFFNALAERNGLNIRDIENQLFSGPGKIVRTLIGGENIDLSGAMDLMSIGYVHPLVQTILCVWAIGRASGAIAGEIDRGTMELLLAQPVARARLVLAHLCVDLLTIPILCLSLWAGTCLGLWLAGPIQVETPALPLPRPTYLVEFGPLKVRMEDPLGASPRPQPTTVSRRDRLRIDKLAFGPALPVVGGLLFAVTGITMALSAAGRSRWRVLGIAVFVVLLQFLVNLVGQMWDVLAPLRPLTIFYYYQPQQVILGRGWTVSWNEWNAGQPLIRLPFLAVLYGIGLLGYARALWTFCRRDVPAPL